MTHAYITLDVLKGTSALNIKGTANDDRLLGLAEASSSVIDRWCNRRFFTRRATLRLDGSGDAVLRVPDLVKVDDGGVRTYDHGRDASPTVWDTDDYDLLPFYADPASVGNPSSRPYTRLRATGLSGVSRCFPAGRGNVEIRGEWGWWRHLRRASQTVAETVDGNATRLTLSALETGRTEIAAGHTLLIGEEQVFARERDGEALTVERGVNGTAAGNIAADSAIDIYEYPAPVWEAALGLSARMWRSTLGGVDDWQPGEIGMDSDIGLLLGPYRKPALGVF